MEFVPFAAFSIEGSTLLIKSKFTSDSYTIILSDTVGVWEQSLTRVEVEEACRRFNPKIELSLHLTLTTIKKHVVEQLATAQYTFSPDGERFASDSIAVK